MSKTGTPQYHQDCCMSYFQNKETINKVTKKTVNKKSVRWIDQPPPLNSYQTSLQVFSDPNVFNLDWKSKKAISRVFEFFYWYSPGIPRLIVGSNRGIVQWMYTKMGVPLQLEIHDDVFDGHVRLCLPNKYKQFAASLIHGFCKMFDEPSKLPHIREIAGDIITYGDHFLDAIATLAVFLEILIEEEESKEFVGINNSVLDIVRTERLIAIGKINYRQYWESLPFTNIMVCRLGLLYRRTVDK